MFYIRANLGEQNRSNALKKMKLQKDYFIKHFGALILIK